MRGRHSKRNGVDVTVRSSRAWACLPGTVVLAVMLGLTLAATPGYAQEEPPVLAPTPTPSDPRAEFVVANLTTCAQIGLPTAIQMGADGAVDATDSFVAGTVTTQGTHLNVQITEDGEDAGVVIDAVVVKGGPASNVYRGPAHVPPAEPFPQNYISPFAGGHTIPEISHWFVCYHLVPFEAGTLVINKVVVAPNGTPVQPLPTRFSVLVTCNNEGFEPVTLEFGNGGGVPSNPDQATIPGLPVGTLCTVVEQNTGDFPPGSAVSVTPPEASQQGVEIVANTGVQVKVINDFSGVAVQKGTVRIVKRINGATTGTSLPDSFTVAIACDDGTSKSVTLPGTGGPASETVSVTAGSLCALAETPASLPSGWTVTYSVNGGPATTSAPQFPVNAGQTVTVTVINTPPELPVTGTSTVRYAGIAGCLIIAGCAMLFLARRRKTAQIGH
jgi:LPXTG-motif cell wall-anchored protein